MSKCFRAARQYIKPRAAENYKVNIDQENPKTDQMQTVNMRDTERHPSAPWPHQISLADAERPAKQLVPLVDLFGAVSYGQMQLGPSVCVWNVVKTVCLFCLLPLTFPLWGRKRLQAKSICNWHFPPLIIDMKEQNMLTSAETEKTAAFFFLFSPPKRAWRTL